MGETCARCGGKMEYRANGWGMVGEGPRRDVRHWGCPKCDAKPTDAAPDAGDKRGLYGKYHVTKAATGEPIDGEAFVLRVDQDEAAQIALRRYAEVCDNDALRADIERWLMRLPKNGYKRQARKMATPDAGDVEALAAEVAMLKDELASASRRAEDADSEATKHRHNARGWEIEVQEAAAREAQLREALALAQESLRAIANRRGDYVRRVLEGCMPQIEAALATPPSEAAQRVQSVIDAARAIGPVSGPKNIFEAVFALQDALRALDGSKP